VRPEVVVESPSIQREASNRRLLDAVVIAATVGRIYAGSTLWYRVQAKSLLLADLTMSICPALHRAPPSMDIHDMPSEV
jgi:hypothetical protein